MGMMCVSAAFDECCIHPDWRWSVRPLPGRAVTSSPVCWRRTARADRARTQTPTCSTTTRSCWPTAPRPGSWRRPDTCGPPGRSPVSGGVVSGNRRPSRGSYSCQGHAIISYSYTAPHVDSQWPVSCLIVSISVDCFQGKFLIKFKVI